MEQIAEIDRKKFLQMVLGVRGSVEDYVKIDRLCAVNFVHKP